MCTQLYKGTCDASREIAGLQPELIILHTPHGISLSDSYALYYNGDAEGNALWNQQWSEFTVWINTNFQM